MWTSSARRFVGGPTNYKPIRDKVCQELGVEGSTEVNPMTAVAEGASLFAESIETGRRSEALPEFRDAALASEYAWRFLRDAREHDLPAIGELETLRQIRERRRTMKDGYGLLRKHA